ncbi:MAG: type II secretion system protein [Minisyncoccia bacterium]
MIYFFKKLKISKLNRGMSYVELIVVLSIFSVLSSVAIYNYGDFQAKVDIKNLASDVALKIVEAQKSSLSGLLPTKVFPAGWNPSYGVYFDLATDDKGFIYFVDLNNSGTFNDTNCTGECISKIALTKGNYISSISIFYKGNPTPVSLNNLTVAFSRPDSGALIRDNGGVINQALLDYARITVSLSKGTTSAIKVYPSGRIQIN